MIFPSQPYPVNQTVKKLTKMILPIFLGVMPLLLLGFLLTPKAAAVPPSGPLLAPGNPIINPISNTHTAPVTTSVSITYDENIDEATVSPQTFAVHAMQTGLLTQTYSVNDGTISLTPPNPLKPGELVQASATTGTLNLDGQGPASSTVWQFRAAVASGSGIFTESGQSLGISNAYDVALGDVDGDGDLDVFIANKDQANQVWWNDGGTFTNSFQALGSSDSRAVALGDLDGDGDLDAFVANKEQANWVWWNDGGTFTDSGQRLGSSYSWDVALGDVDGDGDLDAFVVNGLQDDTVWLNNGSGTFDDRLDLSILHSQAVVLGDVDGNGTLDAFVAIEGPNEVWLNDGSGNFNDSGQRLGNSYSQAVALGDVDGNGTLDAFVTNLGPNEVWLNSGTGDFDDSNQHLDNSDSWAVALGDVDGDGDLDAFVANDGANKIWRNDGIGNFYDSNQRLGNSASRGVGLGDVNDYGDLDAIVANSGAEEANAVWLNETPDITVKINQIIPNPAWFLEDVLFDGSGIPTTTAEFLEYEWTRIPVSETCGSYSSPTLFGTAARIEDNTTPAGEHRICLQGRAGTVRSDYATMTMTVRPDRWAYSDIAVGPKSVSFWADPSANTEPMYHPDLGDTVYVKVEVDNIGVISTPDEVTVFFYDGPIKALLHGPIEGTLVSSDTIDFIAAQSSEFVTIPWTIGGEEGYRGFAVDIEYTANIPHFAEKELPPHDEPHFESDYKNNRTTGAIPVGRITGTYGISVTADIVPIRQPKLYAGYPAYISGDANYTWDVLLAAMGATITIEISDLSGGVAPYCYRKTYQTWTTSPLGHYRAAIQLPHDPGVYAATVLVDDGNLIGTQVITFTVSKPPDPLPDLYVERFSVLLSGSNTYIRTWHDYTFHRVYNRSMLFGVQNEPITITARVRNGGNLAVADAFVVSFYDVPPGGGRTLIGTETVTGLNRGEREEVKHIWTPTQTGIHATQVVVDEANVIAESNEINNYDSYYYRYQFCFNGITGRCHNRAHRDVIDVRAPKPDLMALALKYDVEPDLGKPITMIVEVHNIGHDDITDQEVFAVAFYDGYPNVTGTRVLDTVRVGGPMDQENKENYRTFNIEYTGTVAGPHHICVVVDTDEEIDEELEENNINCWDLYVFPDDVDLYPDKLIYSNNNPLPGEEIEIRARFENRGAVDSTGTEVVTFYHRSIAPANVIATATIDGPIAGRRGTGTTVPIKWTTYNSHGTAYIYVEYIKESGYNHGSRRHAGRLNIRKGPSPDLRVLSKNIHVNPRSPGPGESVSVDVDIANVSSVTATNFVVEFHTSGPTAGYQELGEPPTISSLEPGKTTNVPANETFTMVDKFHAIQVSAWPRIEQGDENYGDNEATTSIIPGGETMLDLAITVGTDPDVCASTDVITVAAGTTVFYCYQVTNQSGVDLRTHDLSDSELGDILSDLDYTLLPGRTFLRRKPAILNETTDSAAIWTASTDPYVFTATDDVTVNVLHYVYLPLISKSP